MSRLKDICEHNSWQRMQWSTDGGRAADSAGCVSSRHFQ